VFALTCEQ